MKYRDIEERLLANSIPVHTGFMLNGEPSECWEWIGNRDHHGYGRITLWKNGKTVKVRAHRAAAEAFLGITLGEHTWDHRCRNTSCIHPNHGEAVPNAENVSRMRDFWRNYRAREAGQQTLEIADA